MLTAFMLVSCEREHLAEVGPRLAAIEGVTEVYTTTGTIDYIAIVRVRDMEALSELVTNRLRGVEGIHRTDTHVALREYSPRDIDAAFQIGVD
ncbi:MAG: Lrp/AsnC ligand binding domain-containing protein [Candidatus Dormibacteraeota bacterium]|nr:Lrp/AsnC ligand binding domain-containing protein [Candidatus Dormibacteraeota bacterium]